MVPYIYVFCIFFGAIFFLMSKHNWSMYNILKSARIIVYSTVSVADWIKPNSGKGCDASLCLCLKCLFCERSKYIPSLACPRLISADSQGRTHTYPAHRRPCPGGTAEHAAHMCRRLCAGICCYYLFFFTSSSGRYYSGDK